MRTIAAVERAGFEASSDEEIVERVKSGDTALYEIIMRRYNQRLYRVARAILHDDAEAEDVMQEAFLLAFRKLPHFRHDASFKTWLLTITWRRALRWRHSPARRLGRLVSLENWFSDIVEHRPTPEQSAASEEIHRDVLRLIRSLPSRLRDPLLLSASGRYSYEELSDILDIPTGTVKWRVFEARRLLRAKLARLGHGRSS